MAIEMPNAFEAAGTFDGFDPSANANPIYSSNGVQPFDPATTGGDPKGGFTRASLGQYLIKLVRPIDVLESICMVSCFPTTSTPVLLCISVIPGVDDTFDGTVAVASDVEAPADAIFSMGVWRTKDTLAGTQSFA